MKRLVFIDDDQSELDAFHTIVEDEYKYETIHWPGQAEELFRISAPSLYVSDLYLPPRGLERIPTATERDDAREAANLVVHRFSGLYVYESWDDKKRLRKTMDAMGDGRRSLDLQWTALGQSPTHGIALCREVMKRQRDVPFVFYSRKITPEDVVAVLQAGAVDAIRKGLDPTELRARLVRAQELYAREDVGRLRAQGLNVNITIIPAR